MDDDFYSNLEVRNVPVGTIFTQEYFTEVPPGWSVIIADIKNSTAAVAAGRSNDVNLVAAGILIVALNIARQHNLDIPFFFGGDGGTLLVPPGICEQVLTAIALHQKNSQENFGFEMHIGHVRVGDINQAGRIIKICRLRFAGGFDKAIVVGDGFRYAEDLIKHSAINEAPAATEGEPDLTGLECRWNKVKPPSEENEVVCYLVEGLNAAEHIELYDSIFKKLDEVYGTFESRNPLSVDRLKLLIAYGKMRSEMMAKYGGWRPGYILTNLFKTLLGHISLAYNVAIHNFNGRQYLAQLVANADTLTVDGRINTILSGSVSKRLAFVAYLQEMENAGKLIYGYHSSAESVMTCYIENRETRHIHFVDGAGGGYTEASKEFKRKFNALRAQGVQ